MWRTVRGLDLRLATWGLSRLASGGRFNFHSCCAIVGFLTRAITLKALSSSR